MADDKEHDPLLAHRPTPAHYIMLQDGVIAAVSELTERGLSLDDAILAEKSTAAEELYIEFTEQLSAYIQPSGRTLGCGRLKRK